VAATADVLPALPPGPTLPPLAQTLAIVGAPGAFLGRMQERYGDVFTIRVLGAAFVVIADPAAIREVFRGSTDVLLAGRSNEPLAPLVGRRSLLLLDGAEHLRERKLLLPPFHGANLRAHERIMERATRRAMQDWPLDRPFALLPAMQDITLEVIMRAVLGVHAGERYDELSARIRDVLAPQGGTIRLALTFMGGRDTPWDRRFAERVDAMDATLRAVIADRRRDPRLARRTDVLSMLLQARYEDGTGLSDEALRDEMVTLLTAGHETTATALAWTFERVLRHTFVRERLEDDLARGDTTYLDAVVKEALRSRPVIPSVGRLLAEPFTVGGHVLPAGTTVIPSVVLTHARDDVFPDAGSFRPERFLGSDTPSTYAWIPFGGGSRRCPGASFALTEMRVVLQTVLTTVRLEADAPDPEPVTRRNVTLAPGRGGRVVRRA
jgi:cytochrome P450